MIGAANRAPPNRGCAESAAVRKAAGLPDVRIHDLRHTWASHAAMHGIPLPVLARVLGHSSARITEIYAHVADEAAASAATRVSAMIAAAV